MKSLTLNITPLALEQTNSRWIGELRPYVYQQQIYEQVQQALSRNEMLCLFIVTPTGSGKTLGSYAYAINNQIPAFGIYPTNELIRDQERALKPWLDPRDQFQLLRIDSQQLDYWQSALDLKQHAATWERLLNWESTILTNPDILFYSFFGLYRGAPGLCQRIFTLVSKYQLFIFDEFHLYNVKQMADVVYLAATLNSMNPGYGRVLIFASATPDSPARQWLQDQIKLPVHVVEAQPSQQPAARIIGQPLQLTFLPADLRKWKGVETLLEYLPNLQRFVDTYAEARSVTILDSVAGAIRLAESLRNVFPGRAVGEVHGLSSEQERDEALRRSFTVGTSTIEVGIDFQGGTEKDVLIYEARTASQFIQRFGRLARHAKTIPVPNWAIALVPEYVYHFLANRLVGSQNIARHDLYRLVEEAYQQPEDFARYLKVHAPAEFHQARWQAQGLFQPDDRPRVVAALEIAIHALTGKTGHDAAALYRRYTEQHILAPLLTFRGSGFEAAILDKRGTDPGFPAKRYNLMFLLHRGIFEELDKEEYLKRLEQISSLWPEEGMREKRYAAHIGLKPEDLLGVYGYFLLTSLTDQARKVWFELNEDQVHGHKAEVTVINGLEIRTEPEMRLRRLNRHLRKKQIVAWFMDCHPAAIKLGRALPSLFEIFELRVRRPGGALGGQSWSIVFNQDAFFVDSLGWWRERRREEAIIV